MNATITKIVKSSDTTEGKEANQFATLVKVKRLWNPEARGRGTGTIIQG